VVFIFLISSSSYLIECVFLNNMFFLYHECNSYFLLSEDTDDFLEVSVFWAFPPVFLCVLVSLFYFLLEQALRIAVPLLS
jgi:hypothetical protein